MWEMCYHPCERARQNILLQWPLEVVFWACYFSGFGIAVSGYLLFVWGCRSLKKKKLHLKCISDVESLRSLCFVIWYSTRWSCVINWQAFVCHVESLFHSSINLTITMPWAIGVHVPVDKAHSSEISWTREDWHRSLCSELHTPCAPRTHVSLVRYLRLAAIWVEECLLFDIVTNPKGCLFLEYDQEIRRRH